MKKLFIALIVAMCCVTAAVLGASRAFGIMNEEGFAMPASAGIVQSLAGGGSSEPISLVKVQYEDVIYSSLTGYYVGQDRQQIDLTYPLYTNGGAGLHFLGDDVWLITPNVDLYQSFDGLYLSNGATYNSDMTQADEGEEFIFLALSNGLYMNAQQAVFTNALGSTVIPINSILRLSEDSICWYEQKNGTMASHSEKAVFGATITIGEHTYQYIDLLDALGLVREAVKDSHTNKPDEDKLQEAVEILNGKDGQNGKKPGVNHGAGDQNGQLPGGRADDQIEGGNQDGGSAGTEPGQHDGDQGPQDAQDNGEHPDEPDDTQGDAEDSSPADDAGKDHEKGDTAGSGTNTDHSNSGTSSGGSGSGSGSSGSGSGGSGGGSGGSSGSSGSAGSGSGGGSGGGSGNHTSTGGSGSGSGSHTSTDGSGSGNTSGENPGGDDKNNGGNSDKVPYQQPEVTLEDMQLWSYGLGIHMRVNDPSGAIMRGVNFAVYKSVKGSGATHTDAQGHTIYPSDSYEGKTSLLRKNKTASSQEFALSTLQPGQTVYLQYSYRYNAEEKDADGNTTITRRRAYSNLIKIKMPTVEEGGVKAVSSDWTVSYAVHSDGMVLSGLTLANTASYDKDAAYSFDNFKLNTLPYVSRLEFTMTPEGGGDPVTVSVGSSVLTRAQQEGGTGFTSSTPKLESNCKYTCTKVEAKDRYGNVIPLETSSTGQAVYTRKSAPEVTITEKENVMDALTISIKVSDPDSALEEGTPLRLTVVNSQTKMPADLYGEWSSTDISDGGESVQELQLKNPKNGKEYELKLGSLAFSCLYAVSVHGDYSPQPDVKDAPGTLGHITNEKLGTLSVYTAALSTGRISFTTGVENLMDTSATVTATMTSDTTINILPLVDEFRIIVKDKQGNTVNSVTLAESVLSGKDYTYDQTTASVMLQKGNDIEPTVTLYGTQEQYSSDPWSSLLIRETYDPDTQLPNGYSKPMQLQVALPNLEHFTEYTFSIQAVVIKSGQEYQIPVNITNNRLMTKKTLPVVQYSDLFLAADVAEFLDLKVYDPDGTILNDGLITIYLYYGDTVLAAKQITADQTGTAKGENLRFDGLISGGKYELRFVASAYNDAEGYGSYKTNYTMESFQLVAGSALSGKVNVTSLKANSEGTYDAKLDVTVNDTEGYLGREGEKSEVTLTIERSDSMEQPSYQAYKTETLPLTTNEDGSLTLDLTGKNAYILKNLPQGDGWRVTLSATYKDSQVLLNQITFRTDADYVSVSTHAELIAAQRANGHANILVTEDFVQDQNTYCDFYGTIDFQGHVVTKGDNITTYFLDPRAGSKISNLVYDYPSSVYYVNRAAIFSNIGGTVENLIIRTQGAVEVTDTYKGLITTSVRADGTLRNFIVRLGGDLICSTEGSDYGGLTTYVYGLMENGYVYGVNGAGFIGRGYSGGSGLFVYTYYNGVIRNMYTVMDSWYQRDGSGYLMTPVNETKHTFYNIYSVGDFYSIDPGANKNYLLPYTAIRVHGASASGLAFQNTWALTSREYSTADKLVQRGAAIKLYDADWQNSILNEGTGGGAFDVDGCVSMGFYPRLELPTSMQRYQEYLPLPVVSQTRTPKIVSDSWATEAPYDTHGLDNGYIKLRFQNDSGATIQSVEIKGLITEVLDQKMASDGLYDVILRAQVTTDDSKADYLSAYSVEQFTYTDTAATRTATSTYITNGFEFWKEVKTTSDWAGINDHMNWNYKLTADLDFSGGTLTPAQVILNGSKTSYSSGGVFRGQLDGQEHVLSGIRLEGLTNAYLIYSVSGANNGVNTTANTSAVFNGGAVRNLLIEDAVISTAKSMSANFCGIIGYADQARLENIRVRNSSVTGGGYLGILVGQANRSSLEGCSAADSTLTDIEVGRPLYAGGLVGYGSSATEIRSCYTYNVAMDISNTTVINCVGGLVGYYASSSIESCYTHGSIKTNGSFVGGINGSVTTGDATYVRRSFSYVDILQTSGDYAGGISGQGYGVSNSIALGNVAGAGANTDRIVSKSRSNLITTVYAYKEQVAGQLTNADNGRANGLLSGEELGRADTWQDTIRLGADWNYDPVARGRAPQLLNDCGRDGWQQQDVFLPGQGSDPALRVEEAVYDGNNGGSYYLVARLTHPGIDSSWIQDAYANHTLSITLNGMNISANAVENKEAKIELGSSESESTQIKITTKTFEKALDTYGLNVKYTENGRLRDLTVMVTYQNADGTPHINYWEIPNLAAWNSVMQAGHGQTGENFKITGTVDFQNGSTEYRELVLGRLEGTAPAEGSSPARGFANLSYNGGAESKPWITKIGLDMQNLSFKNVTFDFSIGKYTRSMTGAILNLSSASNLVIDGLTMLCSQDTRAYFGFISTAGGTVDGVEMTHVLVEDKTPNRTSRYNYTGGLIAYSTGDTNNVHAEDVKVLMPRNSYVGGIQGRQETYGQNFYGNTIKNFEVSGYNTVGGLMGYSYAQQSTGDSAETGTVSGNTEVGGLFGSTTTTGYSASYHQDLKAISVSVTASNGCAGGIAGTSGHFYTRDALVQGCTVKGTSFVGGYLGGNTSDFGQKAIEDLQIVDCTVENTRTSVSGANYQTTGTGGVIGSLFVEQSISLKGITVRNTSVTGPLNVGGFLGTSYRPLDGPVMDRIYIAEDVTVTSTGNIAGGMVGYCDRIQLTNSACGATVTANGNEAGGIIGHAEPQFDAIQVTLKQVYFRGSVTASDYAGGVIGKLNSTSLKLGDSNMNGVLVVADVRSGGEGSLWVNDTAVNGDAGTGLIYICEDSLLNGQTANALAAAAKLQGDDNVSYVPKRLDGVELQLPAARFAEQSFYETAASKGGAGFSSGSWNYTDLTTYMPFTKSYDGKSILTYTDHASDGKTAAGILLPKAGAVGQETVAYVSGVDTVNIENAVPEGQDSVTVNVNGMDYATDANGVLTLSYNFRDDLKVDGETYTAESLHRKVMTYGSFWYYIDTEGAVRYGKAVTAKVNDAEDMQEIGTVAGISDAAVHLWQGGVLDKSGNTYTFQPDDTGSKVTAVKAGTVGSLAKLDAKPIWQDSTVQVYYYFSLYNGVKIPYRVFRQDGQAYTVSASQNTVYDGVVLSTKTEFGKDTRYFALLNKSSGSITPYYSSMKLGTVTNNGIKYISNNLGYSGTVLLAYYENGNVIGVDYHTGLQVCSTLTAAESFAAYAKNTIANITSPGGWTLPVSDGSFYDGENFRNQLTDNGQYDSDGAASIKDGGDGQDGSGLASGGVSNSAFDDAKLPDDGFSADGGEEVNGPDTVDGDTAVSGDGSVIVNGDVAVNGDTAVNGTGADGQVPGMAIPGGQAASGGSNAQAGTGGAAASSSGTAAAAPGSGSDDAPSGTSSNQTVEEAMKELFGATLVAYSDRTGQYEVLDTASLAQGQQIRVADVLAHKNGADSADSAVDNADADSGADHSFSVAWGINRSLDTTERQGFVLIALAAGTGMIVLIALFTKVRRRKK